MYHRTRYAVALLAAMALLATSLWAGRTQAQSCGAVVTVTDSNMQGWTDSSIGGADVQFVSGPGVPPLGVGSAEFAVGANGGDAAQLRNPNYHGTLLSSLSALSYSTYVQQFGSGGQAPYIILNVDYNGDGTTDDLLFFEPVYQDATFCPSNPQPTVTTGTWQTWNALNGCWWSVNGTAGATPGTGVKPLSAIITAETSATIVNSGSNGGVRLVAGFGAGAWDNFVGNVDAFTIGVAGCSTTFNFEPTQAPSNAQQCKNGGWKSFNSPAFRNQGDCVSFVASGGKARPNR